MRNGRMEKVGVDVHTAGETLQADGVKLFDDAHTKLLEVMQ